MASTSLSSPYVDPTQAVAPHSEPWWGKTIDAGARLINWNAQAAKQPA